VSRVSTRKDPSQYKKNYYYHSFKTQLRGQLGAKHKLSWSGWSTRINVTIKHYYYYYSYKTRLKGRPGKGLGHGSEGSEQVDPSRSMDKNNYYYSFKTQLES